MSNMSPMRRLVNIRGGGRVERCHGFRHFGPYSNAEHQWGVAMLMWVLWPEDFPRLSIFCLTHDVPEQWVGDSPAPMKSAGPPETKKFEDMLEHRLLSDLGLPQDDSLSALDRQKIKNCDSLELYMWCMEQAQIFGNWGVRPIVDQLESFYKTSGKVQLLPEAEALYLELSRTGGANLIPNVANVVERMAQGEGAVLR